MTRRIAFSWQKNAQTPRWVLRIAQRVRNLRYSACRIREPVLGRCIASSDVCLENLKDTNWKIAESEVRLRELLDGQAAMIVLRDADGRILFANQAYCTAFAVTQSELSGQRFTPSVLERELLPPGPSGRRQCAERVATSSGLRWILWEHHRLMMVGCRGDMQSVGRDVTEERRAAAELRIAGDGASAANRAKSRFLASMSHEIRTPMNGILGMTSLLALTAQTDEQRSYTDAIDQSARALLVLIDEILDFSKIEAGKLHLASEPFSLRSCVEDAVELIAPKARAKGVDLSCQISADVPEPVIGDAHRVRQIALNLLSNAVKFTDSGSIVVNVFCALHSASADGGRQYSIVVRDTGVGISADAIATLFMEFEQGYIDSGQRPSGTGLGLAISRRIARAMGGDIVAEGAIGYGATFSVRILLRDAPVLAIDRDATSKPRPYRGANCTGDNRLGLSARVLIVEDNPVNALLARKMCERVGASVTVVTSGHAAVSAVRNSIGVDGNPYDIIFMDNFLPDIDGIEATRLILALFAQGALRCCRCPPIVALTASAFKEDRERCLAAGMSDYLAKPFDVQQLSALLTKWLPVSAASRYVL